MQTVHDMLMHSNIYDDCENFDVKVWQPDEQRYMRLLFTGHEKTDVGKGCISFNAYYEDEIGENCVFDAFREMLVSMGIDDENKQKELELEFLKKIIELRHSKK